MLCFTTFLIVLKTYLWHYLNKISLYINFIDKYNLTSYHRLMEVDTVRNIVIMVTSLITYMRNDHSSPQHRISFMLLLNKLMSWQCYILVQSTFPHPFLYHWVQFDDLHQQNSMLNINDIPNESLNIKVHIILYPFLDNNFIKFCNIQNLKMDFICKKIKEYVLEWSVVNGPIWVTIKPIQIWNHTSGKDTNKGMLI